MKSPPPVDLMHTETQWIWMPALRRLPLSFVFFRKSFELPESPVGVGNAWVSASTLYVLYINGERIQRGPAPHDLREPEVDPVDVGTHLRKGRNVIAALVYHQKAGDGRFLPDAARFAFQADVECEAETVHIQTDGSWRTQPARCWPAARYPHEKHRAFHEVFDARRYPGKWAEVDFDDTSWMRSAAVPPPSHALVSRDIPFMHTETIRPVRLVDGGTIRWQGDPEDYYDFLIPEMAVEEDREKGLAVTPEPRILKTSPGKAAVLTFEFREEIVGYPFIRIRAPEGTDVLMVFSDRRNPGVLLLRPGPMLGNQVRLVTKAGETCFEGFDYEAVKFAQVLVTVPSGAGAEEVTLVDFGVERRHYPFAHEPDLKTSDDEINRVIAAGTNTARNVMHETIVDNNVRERQQYTAEIGLAKLGAYYGFGEYRLPQRMVRTFAMGQNREGWFADCWPGLARVAELWHCHTDTSWYGVLIDHNIGFAFDIYHHVLFSGDMGMLEKLYPRLLKLEAWLQTQMGPDGMLPVGGYTWHWVWMDHDGFRCQEDKRAAFNIYYAGYLKLVMATLAEWRGETDRAQAFRGRARAVIEKIRSTYWSEAHQSIVDNLPSLAKDGKPHMHDRSLSMSLLFGVVPEGTEAETVRLLSDLPPEVGVSHPTNACWRLWALCRFGRADVAIARFREVWGSMPSVLQNNTLPEAWDVLAPGHDGGYAWCQATLVPLYVLHGNILGIEPVEPGFRTFRVRPRLGGLEWIEGTVHSPHGPIHLRVTSRDGEQQIDLLIPPGLSAHVATAEGEQVVTAPRGQERRWRMPPDLLHPLRAPPLSLP